MRALPSRWEFDATPPTVLPPQYKAEVVELIRTTGKTVGQVARELDLTETAVREWVKRADLDAGRRSDGLTTTEREELRRLRREVRELCEEREILRKAAVFFAGRPVGLDIHIGRKRVARLMRGHGLQGIHRRRGQGTTRRDPQASPAPHLVERSFTPAGPDRLWVADITQQRTGEGWLYLAVILDAFSRRVVGWSMADHLRTELVLDALDMAISQRQPAPGLVCHSDHGCQYTSFAYGRRLAASELVASMGTVGDALDPRLPATRRLRAPPRINSTRSLTTVSIETGQLHFPGRARP